MVHVSACATRALTNAEIAAALGRQAPAEQTYIRLVHGTYIGEAMERAARESPDRVAGDFAGCFHGDELTMLGLFETLSAAAGLMDLVVMPVASPIPFACIEALAAYAFSTFDVRRLQMMVSASRAESLRLAETPFRLEVSYDEALFLAGSREALQFYGLLRAELPAGAGR